MNDGWIERPRNGETTVPPNRSEAGAQPVRTPGASPGKRARGLSDFRGNGPDPARPSRLEGGDPSWRSLVARFQGWRQQHWCGRGAGVGSNAQAGGRKD